MSQLGTLDIIIAIVVLWFALSGARRGLVLSTYDIVTLGLAIVLAAREFHLAGAYFSARYGWPEEIADVVGFAALLVVGEIIRLVGGMTLGAIVGPMLRSTPILGFANRLGGLIPGALRGIAYIAIVLVAIESVPFFPSLQSGIQLSPFASEIVRVTGAAAPSLSGLMGVVVHGNASAPGAAGSVGELSDHLPLPSGVRGQADSVGVGQLLAMTNLARMQAGVPPLVLDRDLSSVAEEHSLEMFRLAYFAHDSPAVGTPADRARDAGVQFQVLAENIAYASSVDAAFTGLMGSSEHRQNLLSTDFTRVGIGVVRSGIWGCMVTQDFAD